MIKRLLFSFSLCFSLTAQAQPNSVELKDGNGFLLSQHSSITAAYATIPSTITQPYIIELTSTYTGGVGNETYPINLTARSGSSSINTITLRPAGGVGSVSITNTSTGANVLQLNDVDYFILDGRAGGAGPNVLTIHNGGTTSSSNTVALINGACFNVIRNCNITNASTGSAGRGLLFGVSASNTSGNSDNLVTECIFTGGRYVINSSGTAANANTRNTIYNCDIVNMVFAGFWYQSGTGKITLDSNRFYCTAATGNTPYPLIFDGLTDTVIISRNHIYDINNGSLTSLVKGISVRSVSGTNYSLIHNNMIAFSSPNPGSTAYYGIEYATGAGNVNADIYYNTVRIQNPLASGGTSGSVVSAAFIKTGTGAGSVYNIKNNIFINERTGGNSGVQHVALALTSTAGTINIDYNTYYATSGDHVRIGAAVYNNMAAIQTAMTPPNETNSNIMTVQFAGNTDLHLAGASVGDPALAGTLIALPAPLPNVDIDIDNEPRGTTPYRGADESLLVPLSLDLLEFSGMWDNKDVKLIWKTENETGHREFRIERSFDGKSFTSIGILSAGLQGKKTSTYQYIDRAVEMQGARVYYRLQMVADNSDNSYSGVVSLHKSTSAADLAVYPVPFKDQLNLRISVKAVSEAVVTLTDIFGSQVLRKKISLTQGSNDVKISDVSGLSTGTYVLTVKGEGIDRTVTIFKQ